MELEAYLASLGKGKWIGDLPVGKATGKVAGTPGKGSVAVLNYVGSLCPITLGHVACLQQAHAILTGAAPLTHDPHWRDPTYVGCIGLIRVNSDSHVMKKLAANPKDAINAADRLHLCKAATMTSPGSTPRMLTWVTG